MVTNLDTTAWIREQIAMESEGERTPAQPDIQIRADFPRRSFCLYVNADRFGGNELLPGDLRVMKTQCCTRPRIANSDYKRFAGWNTVEFVVVTNRHCMACGSHEHDGKHYTRAEWDALLAQAA